MTETFTKQKQQKRITHVIEKQSRINNKRCIELAVVSQRTKEETRSEFNSTNRNGASFYFCRLPTALPCLMTECQLCVSVFIYLHGAWCLVLRASCTMSSAQNIWETVSLLDNSDRQLIVAAKTSRIKIQIELEHSRILIQLPVYFILSVFPMFLLRVTDTITIMTHLIS